MSEGKSTPLTPFAAIRIQKVCAKADYGEISKGGIVARTHSAAKKNSKK